MSTNKCPHRGSEIDSYCQRPIVSISNLHHQRLEFDSESLGLLALVSVLRVDVYRLVAASLFLISSKSRALSLRNLVSGYECGRVFPAGVGPGSPSRDAANWLPSRFSLSVETRRRYGWLRMMVFPGARLVRVPIWRPSGGWRHARRREHCRGEPGSALSGGYAPDSAKAEGSSIVDEPGEG